MARYQSVILSFVLFQSFCAQPATDHYSIRDGLPTQASYYALQDHDGFLWVSGEAGVSRFDGKNFVTFTKMDGLAEDEVTGLYEDKKGRIWFFPFSKKLSYYYEGKFYSEKNDPNLKKIGDRFLLHNYSLSEDADGNVFIPSPLPDGGIFRIDTNNRLTWLQLSGRIDFIFTSEDRRKLFIVRNDSELVTNDQPRYPIKIPKKLRPLATHWHVNLHSSATLCSGPEGVYRFADGDFRLLLRPTAFPRNWNWTKDDVTMDRQGNILASDLHERVLFFRKERDHYLPAINISSEPGIVCRDNEENIWIPSKHAGLFKIPYRSFSDAEAFRINSRLKNSRVTSCCTSSGGLLWLGHDNGTVSCVTPDSVFHLSHESFHKGFNRIIGLCETPEGNILAVSDWASFYLRYGPKGIVVRELLNPHKQSVGACKGIYTDWQGRPVISLPHGLDYLLHKDQFLSPMPTQGDNTRRFSSYIASDGKWYTSRTDGLFVRDSSGKNPTNLSRADARLQERVHHYTELPDGTLILATYGNGLIAVKDGRFLSSVNSSQGLAGNICRKVLRRNDTLFVATNNGVSVIRFRNGSFELIKTAMPEAARSTDVNDLCFNGNILYAATSSGLVLLRLPSIAEELSRPPKVFITEVLSGGRKYDPIKQILLPYSRDRELALGFIAPVMDQPARVSYRYRIKTHNEQWHLTSANRLEFSDLSYGSYVLELQAKKHNSDWGDSTLLTFTIATPFYLSGWFIAAGTLSGIVAILLLIRLFVRYKLRKHEQVVREQSAVKNERMRIAADMHDEIGSELTNLLIMSRTLGPAEKGKNDHFRFESLLNDLICRMNEVIWALNPDNDTSFSLMACIRAYAVSFAALHGLSCEVAIEESLYSDLPVGAEKRRNLFLIVKELLNNTVKHAQAKSLKISIRSTENSKICLGVSDDGKGFRQLNRHNGNGLLNIEKRVASLRGLLLIDSQPGKGTFFEIVFPI